MKKLGFFWTQKTLSVVSDPAFSSPNIRMQEIVYQLLPIAIAVNAALLMLNLRLAVAPQKIDDR
jgi:hypothetical protein